MKKILDFKEMFNAQRTLQSSMGWPNGHGEAGCKENLLHAIVEIVEALNETNFKNWKKQKLIVNRIKLATELTDIFQFLTNAALAMDLTAEDLTLALRAKWDVNQQRIDDGEVRRAEQLQIDYP